MSIASFDTSVILRTLPYLLAEGMVFTVKLTAFAACFGLFFGSILALMRLYGGAVLGRIAVTYVNFIRAVPLVLGIFWFYFLVPYVGAWLTGASRPISVGGYISAYVTFTLFEAAYFSETIRAGIQSISLGQIGAARALGMNFFQQMRYVILPQAFRRMTPILLTQVIMLFQDTSLVYVLSLDDFLGAASKIAQRDNRLVEMYVFAAAMYFVVSFAASTFVKHLQNRLNRGIYA